jgi:hypothetical protein
MLPLALVVAHQVINVLVAHGLMIHGFLLDGHLMVI